MYEEGTVVGGRYRLIRQVGEGGMATIWKAEHLTLHSPVAVKFLHTTGRASKEMTERFLREARAAAHVRHRNVIEITDFGLTDDNVPYMVMEYLHGQSLADLMEHDPTLDPVEAVRIASLTLRGLAAVHDAGIVHRDLKPENIFLVEDADGTFPKLLDFGVARRVGLSSDITQEGALIGTPDYMSPEQARADRDIDLRTDIYSMGVILYEMITGRLPFEAERLGDLIKKIATQTPPTVAELRPDLPEAVSDVVERAMAHDRDRRFATAREMRWALIEAGEVYGFRHTHSALISISELPPPTTNGGADAPSSTSVTLPRPAPTPSGPLPTLGSEAAHTPMAPLQEREDSTAAHAPTVHMPPRSRRRAWPYLLLVVLLAAGGAGAWLYLKGATRPADVLRALADPAAQVAEPAGPEPWEPASDGLPPGVLDTDVDAGAQVIVELLDVPADASVQVDGVPVEAPRLQLPVLDHAYVIEVRGSDGRLLWRTEHPGDRHGAYAVLPAPADEVSAAAQPEPVPSRRKRRRRRR